MHKPDRASRTFARPLWSEAVEDRDSVKRYKSRQRLAVIACNNETRCLQQVMKRLTCNHSRTRKAV